MLLGTDPGELHNYELSTTSRDDFSADQLSRELDRTADVIRKHALTGADVSYWIQRESILNALLDA
jgi:hypothetical protein